MDREISSTGYRLSPLQEGMLFDSLVAKIPGVDIEQIVFELNEEIDPNTFEAAWQRVVNRHPALRTSFHWQGLKQPLQQVQPSVTLPFRYTDLRDQPKARQNELLTQHVQSERKRGFDLTAAPLLRLDLFCLGARHYKALLTLHHIVMDGRAFPLIFQEAFETYQALLEGREPNLSSAPPYRNFIDWLQKQPASETFWRESLKGFTAATPLIVDTLVSPAANAAVGYGTESLNLSESLTQQLNAFAASADITLNTIVQGAWALLLSRYSGEEDVVFGATRAGRQSTFPEASSVVGLFINTLPMRIRIFQGLAVRSWLKDLRAQQIALRPHEHTSLLRIQEWSQVPRGNALFESLLVFDHADLGTTLRNLGGPWLHRQFEQIHQTGYPLTLFAYAKPALQLNISYDLQRFTAPVIQRMLGHLYSLLEGMAAQPDGPLVSLPLLTAAEREQILVGWNQTAVEYADELCLHQLIEEQARKTPDATALVFKDQTLTYTELNTRANQLAHYLQKLKVGPDVLVGLCLEVSCEMVIGMLAVLKAGGAYVPLDPNYPQERLGLIMLDTQMPVLLTHSDLVASLPEVIAKGRASSQSKEISETFNCAIVCLDTELAAITKQSAKNPFSPVLPENLAYVIYTSGSTGKPKGVMVTHGNVVNFFTGMDIVLGKEPGTWLNVTSISFDISVLELLWTLARGFKVILHRPESRALPVRRTVALHTQKKMDFSLFYFASDEGARRDNKYHLVLEGAKFADQHGFTAIWTPERHFHSFGGLYPNPGITSAAIAAITQRVQIRAGSVVAPLHQPIRLAEDWAMVDNLSNGRVGISFAPGWQINDFVLAPGNYAQRKQLMLEQINLVRRLWRGEKVTFTGADGKPIRLGILPRPIQPELPIWLTAAGNPETYQLAGELGFNLLTHLLNQDVAELAQKIAIYRQAWKNAGHPGQGHVSLMLHTFLGNDPDEVREIVRPALTAYLKTSVDLMKNAPWLPAVKQPKSSLTEEELNAVSAHAFDRYFQTSGLFGTPATCGEMIDRLAEFGVDEVACLIDFGIASDEVLSSLEHLNQLKEETASVVCRSCATDTSLAAEIQRHGVTHLQCTPSLASIIAQDSDALDALKTLKFLLLGGEALPLPLVQQLKFPGKLLNMYGPTETTVWSTTSQVDSGSISIGRPIANTQIYILDRYRRPLPVGVPGEIYIGGAGVARGYFKQPALTSEKFIPNPFAPQTRLYRTGDLARYLPNGAIECLGRTDHQIKLRGFRIELGEIEAVLARHPHVQAAAVTVREDFPGDKRLVAYIVPAAAQPPDPKALREHVSHTLPDYMVPSKFVTLKDLPLTANGKVDRKSLPAPEHEAEPVKTYVPPANALEETVAKVWRQILSVEKVSRNAHFFESGGHSLLAIQVVSRLREELEAELPVRLVFDQPILQNFARELQKCLPARSNRISARTDQAHGPLSFAQERLWFLDRLEPGPQYNEHYDLRLKGPLDVPLLEKALNKIVQRHQVLRTCFPATKGKPIQKILHHIVVSMPVVDLTHTPAPEHEAANIVVDHANQPFDLSKAPLFRTKLLRLDPEDHILALTFHHIIVDGWSLGVFVRELAAIYDALRRGKAPALPDLPIQYPDYARWQSVQFDTPAMLQGFEYWTDHLKGAPPLLELPWDNPRPPHQTFRGARANFSVETAAVQDLAKLGQQEGCTPFMTLMAAFQVLLHRYSGNDDILVGTPVANRTRPELENLIGCFLNTIVCRTKLGGAPSFREILRRVRETTLGAFAHQEVPFEKVVEKLQPVRNLSYSPVFQVMFIWQNAAKIEPGSGPLQIQTYPVDTGVSKFDLTLIIDEKPNGLSGVVEYATELFKPASIERMIVDFQALLSAIVSSPDKPISGLPLLNSPEGKLTGQPISAPVPVVASDSHDSFTPRTSVEKIVARIWKEVLGCGDVGMDENFFELGGHSLLITRIISRIRAALKVELTLRSFFENPTIKSLSAIIENSAGGPHPIQKNPRLAPVRNTVPLRAEDKPSVPPTRSP